MKGAQKGPIDGLTEQDYFNEMEQLEIIQDNEEDDDYEDLDNSDMEAMYYNQQQIRMAQTNPTSGNRNWNSGSNRQLMSDGFKSNYNLSAKGQRPITSA